MKPLSIVSACALALLLCVVVTAERVAKQSEAVEIPLKEIWAYNMPGTRDLQKVEDRLTPKQWEEIRRSLSVQPPQGKKAGTGFAVVGVGPDAMREVHVVLVEGKKPSQIFPSNSDVSLVFYSYQFNRYVHLRSVSRRGNVIEIQYQFVPHKTKELTEHFALIPLSKLQLGKVQVDVVQAPMAQEFVRAEWKPVGDDTARQIVCGSFSFEVE
jgi:hypothetical protein